MSRTRSGNAAVAALMLEDPAVSVEIRRSRAARRLSLSVSHIDGAARLTAPPDCPDSTLLRFLENHRDWLRDALGAAPSVRLIGDGLQIPFAGEPIVVRAAPGKRGVRLLRQDRTLLVGGPASETGRRAVLWLREQARARLLERSTYHAERLQARFSKISIRDTRSRWGSCSSTGALSYSWRLIFAPPSVLDYVAAHEVAHLREMNHSDRFWKLVERLKPDWREDRDWLRQEGAQLHRYQPAGADPSALEDDEADAA